MGGTGEQRAVGHRIVGISKHDNGKRSGHTVNKESKEQARDRSSSGPPFRASQ